MKFQSASELSRVLSNKELKAKHLQSDNYFSVLCLKKKLQEHINITAEGEAKLADEFGATVENGMYKCEDKSFFEKLAGIRKDFEFTPLNFIPKGEFKKWADELDIHSGEILAEYLLTKPE